MTIPEFYEVQKILRDRRKALEFYNIPSLPAEVRKWLEDRITYDTEKLKELGLEE